MTWPQSKLIHSRMLDRSWCREEAEALEHIAMGRRNRANEIAIDVGAYVGYYTLMMAELGFGSIHAIEPNTEAFDILERVVMLNYPSEQLCPITAWNLAAWDSEQSQLAFDPGAKSSMRLRISPAHTGWIKGQRLDRIIPYESHRSVGLIKIDVEGDAHRVLSGAHGFLIASAHPALLIEYHNELELYRVQQHLQALDYSIWSVGQWNIMATGPKRP